MAPVGVVCRHHGVKHGLRDLGCRLGGQTLGKLDALRVLRGLLQLGLHIFLQTQVPVSGHGPALMTINRVRAGTTNHLNLPLFEDQSPCASLF